jgi:threonylcarbamoyladenosine tRNA methylthiotransferase MtaB
MLRRMRRLSKKAVVIATGCVGEVSSDELVQIPGVDRVFGTKDRAALVDYIFQLAGHTSGALVLPVKKQSRARAFLKVQDGCQRNCAYCIVPAARGGCRSIPVDEVLEACRELSKAHKEIVITGVDISQYGVDLESVTLIDLMEALSAENDISRIRMTSVHPTVVDERFAGLLTDSKRF